MMPEDQANVEKRLGDRRIGASDTIRNTEGHTAIGAFGSGALETDKTDGNRRDGNPVGASDTHSSDESGIAVGAFSLDICGAFDAHYGVFDRSIGASDTHSMANHASPLARLTPIMAVLTALLARVTPIGMAQMTFVVVRLAQ